MQPIRIVVTDTMLGVAKRFAEAACLGGSSSVREADRLERLMEDQVVGQLGQMALAIWKDGHLGEYLIQRAAANTYPTHGDGGSDLVGSNVDVKASLMRSSLHWSQYRLPVRPAEMHDGWVYVLALVEIDLKAVLLAGFAVSSELKASGMEHGGPFAGAHTMSASELRPLPPIDWRGRWGLA